MNTAEKPDNSEILQLLPSIDTLVRSQTAGEIQNEIGTKHLTALARCAVKMLRQNILDEKSENRTAIFSRESLLSEAERYLKNFRERERKSGLQKVINATGVIVHTNLGRAPLSENARKAVFGAAAGYCNLEYDLETGRRGRRGARAEQLLAALTGAEDALIVNNCAAAAFLVLSVLAESGEVIVSRGELVEIGGDFRVPDVMKQSGATMREIGTTNRTKAADYENAINENTRLIAKIHPSNFRVVGFTKSVRIAELAGLARRRNVLLYEDAGSGAMFDLSSFGLDDEPVVSRSISEGADIVTFSGDKLLGGAQSGLIAGRSEIIEKLRRHPLYRILRVDKLIYAALEATLEAFQRETAESEIPVLQMLSQTGEQIRRRTEKFAANLRAGLPQNSNLSCEMTEGSSVVGGGSAPSVKRETTLLALQCSQMSAEKLERNLRFSNPPVIARILDDQVLMDLRTVSPSDEAELLKILTEIK